MKRLGPTLNGAVVLFAVLAVVVLLGLPLGAEFMGDKAYVVMSGSMEPAIHTGSVVVAQPAAPETLKVGDVIVYNLPKVSESITHRIIELKDDGGKPGFVTKGDANGGSDDWTVQYQDT